MSHVEDNKNNGWRGTAPLRHFLNARRDFYVNTASTSGTTVAEPGQQYGFYQIPTDGPENCNERSTCGPQRLGSGYRHPLNDTPKPRSIVRPRKSKPALSNSKIDANNTLSRVDGFCECGAEIAPYDQNRCENCFADDSEKYTGKSQSVTLWL